MSRKRLQFWMGTVCILVLSLVATTQSLAAYPSGLIGWWPANGSATDTVGPHHGGLGGDATYATGISGQAFKVGGTSVGYVNTGGWNPGPQWTIEAWVNPFPGNPGGRLGIAGGIADCRDWGIVFQANQFGAVIFPGGCTATVMSGVIGTPGTWYHVIATNDGTAAKIYVDGVLRNSGLVFPNYLGTTSGTWFGGEVCCGGDFFHGLIDEVKIYNRALSPSEIAELEPTLKLAPPSETNGVGASRPVTATATIDGTTAATGVTVNFTVTGANTASGSCTTDATGQCAFTYTGSNGGDDTISASATIGSAARSAGATKTWTIPTAVTLSVFGVASGLGSLPVDAVVLAGGITVLGGFALWRRRKQD